MGNSTWCYKRGSKAGSDTLSHERSIKDQESTYSSNHILSGHKVIINYRKFILIIYESKIWCDFKRESPNSKLWSEKFYHKFSR